MLGFWNIPARYEMDRNTDSCLWEALLLYCITVAVDSGQRSVLYLHMNMKLIQMSENQEMTVMVITSKFKKW